MSNKIDNSDCHRYDDIINLEAPTSANHPRMPRLSRAAQFAPFSALTGHDELIDETARFVDRKIILDDSEIAVLSDRLSRLSQMLQNEPEVSVTYFVPDDRKSGGKYVTHTGTVKKIDAIEHRIVFADNVDIRIDDIIGLGGRIFDN